MPRRPHRLVLIAAATVALAGYTAYWFVLAGEAREGIARWSQNLRDAGYAVSHAEPDLGGFPLSLRARVATPSVGRGGARTWGWRGEGVTITLRPWNLSRIRLRLDGGHEITVGEGRARHYAVDAASAVAVVSLDAGSRLGRFDAALDTIEVREDGWREPLRIGRLRLDGIGYRRAGGGAPATDISLVIEDAALPAAPQGPLGRTVARIRADITVVGADTPELLLRCVRAGNLPLTAADYDELVAAGGGPFEIVRHRPPHASHAGAWKKLEAEQGG